ncbi:tRNA lysidine(34) synthetase TilS [Pararobbsia alpina]|uniref:tRNA(Ile)-lysidine synthase n=1 Tax=Pararobbsia alpina TaxID=621374 RepID=A0A6S7CMH3_9BURK|nr:tRNA lysidine(34) synthetase TilS [Pararobbsia alpina]CAB3783569.1 tRNA(Ile)-lysidine synthase [Pararobbsia alpina]
MASSRKATPANKSASDNGSASVDGPGRARDEPSESVERIRARHDPAHDADQQVLAAVRAASALAPVAVAFSGGLDSAVLLDAVCAVLGPSNCIALHIHHGLSVHADAWLAHARHVAEVTGAGFVARRVDLGNCAGQGVEAAARGARYAALFELCDTVGATTLMLGHHADDQAETFLLQALRGAGLRGLSAMPAETRDRHAGLRLLRPLLALPRSVLLAYAQRRGLQWIDDESNDDPRFARNALRHRVLASLDEHFPAYREGLARSARHAAEAQGLLDEVAALDLQTLVVPVAEANPSKGLHALSLIALRALDSKSPPRAVNLLRYWLREEGLHAMSTARLENLIDKLRTLADDRSLNFMHAAHVLRHYRGVLSWEPAAPADDTMPAARPSASTWVSTSTSTSSTPSVPLSVSLWTPPSTWVFEALDDKNRRAPVSLDWSGEEVWHLAAWRGSLVFAPTQADDPQRVATSLLRSARLVARAREGGERLRRVAGGSSRSLKNLFQQAGVPAWRRDVPLLFCGEQLIFVPGIGLDSAAQLTPIAQSDAQQTWRRIEWRPDTVLA